MIRLTRALALGFFAALTIGVISPALAQQAGDGPPVSGIVPLDNEGKRLGNVVNDQVRQFKMRRDCELDLPECLPEIRTIIEDQRRSRMYMGIGIVAILLLIVLLAMRESEKKKERMAKELANHLKLGHRVKSKWRNAVKDPYKEADPLGDE
jgi:hypothetical protein